MESALERAPVVAPPDAVEVVQSPGVNEWDAFVNASPRPLFHRAAWAEVWRAYGLRSFQLAARRNQQVVGILPLVYQRSPMTGRQLVSLPWFDAAGLMADDDAAAAALVDAAVELSKTLKAGLVQIRQVAARPLSEHVRTDKVLMELPLPADPEALWKGLNPKVRNQVRKAEKAMLAVSSGGEELLGEFFDVYSRNMRDLGSPSHSEKLFRAVATAFPDEVRVWVVRLEERAIGGGLTIANGNSLEIPWASSLREHNSLCVNHLMYWRILEQSCRDGFRSFRFGRSTINSGTYHFKKQWGAEEVPLNWYFVSASPKLAAAAAIPPQESFGWASRVWQKLPLAVARRLGPRLIAGIP